MDTETRFWAKVNKTNDCWLWIGWHTSLNYGLIKINGKSVLAHRYSYELVNGKIPNGKVLDHLCRTPACVRPAHLEAVSQRENLKRAVNHISMIRAAKTHCIHGHALSGDNLYVRKDGKRACKTCKNQTAARAKMQT